MNDKEYLIRNLLDKNLEIGLRDDCAMDLAVFNDEEVLQSLFKCASDPNEDNMIQASCGESIAEIMVRSGSFETRFIVGLSIAAKVELKGYFEGKHPDWVNHL